MAFMAVASLRKRARDLGIAPGQMPTGPLNAITDVPGVLVGHVTLIEGDRTRTGATAIRAHGGNLFQDKVPAGLAILNGYGKLAGATQVMELGEIETPIVLTNTLGVGRAIEAVNRWTLALPGMSVSARSMPWSAKPMTAGSTISVPVCRPSSMSSRRSTWPRTDRWRKAASVPAPARSPSAVKGGIGTASRLVGDYRLWGAGTIELRRHLAHRRAELARRGGGDRRLDRDRVGDGCAALGSQFAAVWRNAASAAWRGRVRH